MNKLIEEDQCSAGDCQAGPLQLTELASYTISNPSLHPEHKPTYTLNFYDSLSMQSGTSKHRAW